MAENTTATKTFRYNLPNKMYDSSDSDGLTASATYVGLYQNQTARLESKLH